MTEKTALLFGVHAHQPTGNFPEVIDHAHLRCYRPFIQTLYRHPDFRFAAHFSGPLLDYLCERYPQDMDLLAAMAARGQVEMFGGGDAEPVLAMIPERDRAGQIGRLSQKLAARFGQRPQGAWLTERVWESTVVPSLEHGGIRYVTVDDYHFRCAGIAPGDLNGYFTTEEGGARLDLYPISEALRYRIPFAPVAETVAFMEAMARPDRACAAVYFDDIEKFGVWPKTYEWVYENRWLENFIEAVLASGRIETRTYADYHAGQSTRGTVYLPTVSYIEMNEWTLPPAAAATYASLVAQSRDSGHYEQNKPFLRGGIWKNFLTRYPESNWMHKRMLDLSMRLARIEADPSPPQARKDELTTLLYAAQANDAYWHGLFGGLYLPHLRRGIYRNLVSLEAALDSLQERPALQRSDIDLDGIEELTLHNDRLQAIIKMDGRAGVVEFDDYLLRQNFGDTLRRHGEHYHGSIDSVADGNEASGAVESPHERIRLKHAVTRAEALPDPEPQSLFRDSFATAGGVAERLDQYRELQAGKADVKREVDRPAERQEESQQDGALAITFVTACTGGSIEKRLSLDADTLCARYRFEGIPAGEFSTRLSLAMPSCDGVAGRYVVHGVIQGGFGQTFDWAAVDCVMLEDLFMGGSVALLLDPPAHVSVAPYHSVSQSEDGLERIMQSVNVRVTWPVNGGEERLSVTLSTAKIAD